MNQYDKAAMMIGKYGTGAESDAIVKYLEYISAVVNSQSNGVLTQLDEEIINNVKERISDEINHLLGDTLDAMRLADLKVSSDDINQIFAGFMELVDWTSNTDSTALEVKFTDPKKDNDRWKVEAEVKPAVVDEVKFTDNKNDLINL